MRVMANMLRWRCVRVGILLVCVYALGTAYLTLLQAMHRDNGGDVVNDEIKQLISVPTHERGVYVSRRQIDDFVIQDDGNEIYYGDEEGAEHDRFINVLHKVGIPTGDVQSDLNDMYRDVNGFETGVLGKNMDMTRFETGFHGTNRAMNEHRSVEVNNDSYNTHSYGRLKFKQPEPTVTKTETDEGQSVSVIKVDKKEIASLRRSSVVRHYGEQLYTFFKPVLDTSVMKKHHVLEQYHDIVAVLSKFVYNTAEPMYTHRDIERANVTEFNVQNNTEFTIDCSNIHYIQLQGRAGKGTYKFVYSGNYFGKGVVVKVSKKYLYPSMAHRYHSYIRTNVGMLKEIFIQKYVSHPMIEQPRGYCIHDGMNISGVYLRPGLTAVYDFGNRFGSFEGMPWKDRLGYAVYVADFLRYVDNTTLGRMLIGDFSYKQFYMANGRIIMSDTHLMEQLDEASCHLNKSHEDVHGNYTISDCKYNLFAAQKTFFQHLLIPAMYPVIMRATIRDIGRKIDSYSVSPNELYETLEVVQRQYQDSGL